MESLLWSTILGVSELVKELLVVILGDGRDDELEEEKKSVKLLHHQHITTIMHYSTIEGMP